jgi:GT2 family glycosyltransferase
LEKNSDLARERLAIVVPVFNRFDKMDTLLADLGMQTWSGSFQVIVVDHGTKDYQAPPGAPATVIKRSSDLWFTGAMNAGLRHLQQAPNYADLSHIVLINDDVRLPDPGFLERMVARATESSIVGCMALDPNGKVIYTGVKLGRFSARYLSLDEGKPASQVHDGETICDVLPTRGICFRKSALERVGLLAEAQLPQYGSDFEWTSRARRMGFELVMLRSTHLITRVDDRPGKASGRVRYPSAPFASFMAEFMNPKRMGSLPLLLQYTRLVFSPLYRWYFVSVTVARRFAGFIFTNFLRG